MKFFYFFFLVASLIGRAIWRRLTSLIFTVCFIKKNCFRSRMPRTSLPTHIYHHKSHDNVDKKKVAKELPGPRRTRFGSTLTARDPNSRASKSSVSSVEETFHTALKEHEDKKSTKYNRSKVFRNSTYSHREKENDPKVEFHDAEGFMMMRM